MAPKLKTLVSLLSKRGPHRVLRGDLALVGLPGSVFTPASGLNLPAVAFGHAWLTGPARYQELLAHLASWGIVAAAPGSERGPIPSHLSLAADLRTTLDVCTGVRLGPGEISVHPDHLALAGHGMGAGAAVLAAREFSSISAVAALFPAPTSPPAELAAAEIEAPGLIVAGAGDASSLTSNASKLAQAWAGEAVLRTIKDASNRGLAEGRTVMSFVGVGGPESKTQATTRALLTGFLLYHLTEDKKYQDFASADSTIPRTQIVSPDDEEEGSRPGASLAKLLGR